MNEPNEALHRLGSALEYRLDGAVAPVRDPAADAVLVRVPPRRVAEEDALDVAVNDDAPPDHAS